MERLIACSHCRHHVFASATSCPHCGVTLATAPAPNRAAAAFVLGLALTGCPSDSPNDDGANATSDASTNGSSSNPDSATSVLPATSSSDDATSSSDDATTFDTAAAYGVPTTGFPDETSSSSDESSSSSSTGDDETDESSSTGELPQPEYGVPATSG